MIGQYVTNKAQQGLLTPQKAKSGSEQCWRRAILGLIPKQGLKGMMLREYL